MSLENVTNVEWTDILKTSINLGSHYKIVPTEGYLAWEYNPLRNYRLSEDMYEKDGKYYTKQEIGITELEELNYLNLLSQLNLEKSKYPTDDSMINNIRNQIDLFDERFSDYTLREAGELVDFITNELSFNLQHPVEILPQYSYDGSVNLILNDGLNIPRLINSRFTVTGNNTYKIVDRKGDNDTNIYDQGIQFDVDTSLFKNVNKIPQVKYLGTSTGNMKIGNYHFYFKYADADGNESDWVAESGLVSVFIGESPLSVNTGLIDENSIKSVSFQLTNIDVGYSFVKVYYTRYSGDVDSNLVVQAKRIDKNFLISNQGNCLVLITGDENETEVTLEEINSSFDVIQTAKTQCAALNRLFMANVHKTKIEYDVLSKLSLCFCPYKTEENYPLINEGISESYSISSRSYGYYDSEFIYNKTGYWPNELYRLGIVYILKDGSLSPVFNIRGATNIPIKSEESVYYKVENDFRSNKPLSEILDEIDYSEDTHIIIGGIADNENAKGVIQLSQNFYTEDLNSFPIVGINITANKEVIKELKNYVKGFFFVRQKRIPLTLAQGIVIGIDKESRTPTLPTLAGLIDDINTENTFIESEDINDINFISEGFLSRYKFEIKAKKSSIWKKIGKIFAVVAVIAAAAVASIFTFGAAAVGIGAGLATAFAVGGALVMGTIGVVGITAAVVAGAAILAVGVLASVLKVRLKRNKRESKEVKGRHEDIPEGYERKERNESRKLTHDIQSRYIIKGPSKNKPEALIVPDYLVNMPYYNQFLTGETFTIKLTIEQPITNYLTDGYFENKNRHFYVSDYYNQDNTSECKVLLVGLPDGCPVKIMEDTKFKARAGYPEEAYKYEFQGDLYEDTENKKANSDIVRGNYGSYVGMIGYTGHTCDLVNIMIPGYRENLLHNYLLLRALDTSAFYAISDRIDINNINKVETLLQNAYLVENNFEYQLYRGDCYICQYTHRIIRNFNDPSAPYNDVIVDENTWKDNYDPDNVENYAKINLGDVNAVLLGLWLTFNLRSSYNLNIRTIDKSHVDEHLMCGNYRSFYPHYGQLADGNLKIPDSDQYNKGFSKSVSEKYYFELPDVPYIKLEFQNRIVFSDIHVNDAYKNGFRVLRSMNHKDYPMTYGSITKILELKNLLLLIFEHGIGLVAINNNAEHTSLVLSDLNMISDTYGSLWKDSVIKTPSGVYGVDTVAKKIWRVKGGELELISDMRVQDFLNQNISLSERELTPIIGIRNVKTLYNAYKHDVMFTFYDNLYGIHEKSWNLCWNEILGMFTTFYSWIPSEMQNIDNIPFSFDRTTVKSISKLGVSDHSNDFSDGVTLSNNIINILDGLIINSPINSELDLTYTDEFGLIQTFEFLSNESDNPSTFETVEGASYLEDITDLGFVGFLYLDNRTLPEGKVKYKIEYLLLRDIQNNYKEFEIRSKNLYVKPVRDWKSESIRSVLVYYLVYTGDNPSNLISELYYRNKAGHAYADVEDKMYKPSKDNNTIKYWLPIFKNKAGKRLMLPENELINKDKVVRYLNIKATISLLNEALNATEAYFNQFVDKDSSMVEAGYFESTVAVTTNTNLQFLSTDFWKHGLAGIIDISDKIYPTYWYGRQHPFEFEFVVVDDPSVHKIFTNLELVSNKAKPESFHYEVVGDAYDFADDKPTMYFRLEALKALYQYNGYDIEYNSNFLEIEPKQHNRSADLPKYYFRVDSVNEIYDSYKRHLAPSGFNYDHLAGAEVVYYPTRNEFRIWNHVLAIDIDSLNSELTTSVIKANCRYLEDKWLVSINPIIVTYKNEFDKVAAQRANESMFTKEDGKYKYSTWVYNHDGDGKLPPINIRGTKLDTSINTNISFPGNDQGVDNALYNLYNLNQWNLGEWRPIDPTKNSDRRETDVRGKFIKIRIRYSGEELAIIDFLNTIYQISFA